MTLSVRISQDERTVSDLAELLWEYTVAQGWQDDPGHTSEIETLPGEYAEPDGAIAVAYRGGVPVGCAVVRTAVDDTGLRYAEMRRLYVCPGARREGVARAIVTALDGHASSMGHTRMRLVSLGDMKAAHELYRSLGFADVGVYRRTNAPEPVFMEKRLGD